MLAVVSMWNVTTAEVVIVVVYFRWYAGGRVPVTSTSHILTKHANWPYLLIKFCKQTFCLYEGKPDHESTSKRLKTCHGGLAFSACTLITFHFSRYLFYCLCDSISFAIASRHLHYCFSLMISKFFFMIENRHSQSAWWCRHVDAMVVVEKNTPQKFAVRLNERLQLTF